MRTSSEVVEMIKNALDENEISISELARRVGMAKSGVSRYINGTREFPINRADDFAKALGMDVDCLLGINDFKDTNTSDFIDLLTSYNYEVWTDSEDLEKGYEGIHVENPYTGDSFRYTENEFEKNADEFFKLIKSYTEQYKNSLEKDLLQKFYGENPGTSLTKVYTVEKVAAGHGYSYIGNEKSFYYTDRSDLKNYDLATVITGDSMYPKYNDGDVVLVKQGYDNVNGDIYVIDYDGQSYVKRLFNDGDRFRLVSINDKYENIVINIPTQDKYFNIVGKVVDSFTPIEI